MIHDIWHVWAYVLPVHPTHICILLFCILHSMYTSSHHTFYMIFYMMYILYSMHTFKHLPVRASASAKCKCKCKVQVQSASASASAIWLHDCFAFHMYCSIDQWSMRSCITRDYNNNPYPHFYFDTGTHIHAHTHTHSRSHSHPVNLQQNLQHSHGAFGLGTW